LAPTPPNKQNGVGLMRECQGAGVQIAAAIFLPLKKMMIVSSWALLTSQEWSRTRFGGNLVTCREAETV
jgi:hypothetical protein